MSTSKHLLKSVSACIHKSDRRRTDKLLRAVRPRSSVYNYQLTCRIVIYALYRPTIPRSIPCSNDNNVYVNFLCNFLTRV